MSIPKGKKNNKDKKENGKSLNSHPGKNFSGNIEDDFIINNLNSFPEDNEYTGANSSEEEENEAKFLEDVKKFEIEHRESKIVNVYEFIGKPKIKKVSEINSSDFREEYGKLVALLDEKNIFVHFKNEYPVKEKYRFITEEILKQDVEDLSNTHLHINFIYEDFHPELDEDDEEY